MRCVVAIDADPDTLDLFRAVLSLHDYATVLCQDSAAAVDCARQAHPDAIILDLHLTVPDGGWTVFKALKADLLLCRTPVIVCTADVHAVRRRADELHSHNAVVLLKPFDIDDLLALVRLLIDGQDAPARAS
jgi:DNA-binding response OmpR family regulator